MQAPFDFAQGRLSTAFAARNAPNFVQYDNVFCLMDFSVGTSVWKLDADDFEFEAAEFGVVVFANAVSDID